MYLAALGKRDTNDIAGRDVNGYNPQKGQFGSRHITDSPFNPEIPSLEIPPYRCTNACAK